MTVTHYSCDYHAMLLKYSRMDYANVRTYVATYMYACMYVCIYDMYIILCILATYIYVCLLASHNKYLNSDTSVTCTATIRIQQP